MKIIDNVYIVPGVIANSYLLVDPDGLTVIDAGLPYSEKRTLKYIASLGRSANEIRRILITHADLDHYGCLASLQKASGACTFASQAEAEAMAKGQSSRPVYRNVDRFQRFVIGLMGRFMKALPFQVEEFLADGQVLPVLGGLKVVATPGHSPGHLSFYAPSAAILFCGDSMRSDGKRGLRGSRSRNNWDQSLANASVARQAKLGAKILCPGHGPVVTETGELFPVETSRK